jgi:hypothetical protein
MSLPAAFDSVGFIGDAVPLGFMARAPGPAGQRPAFALESTGRVEPFAPDDGCRREDGRGRPFDTLRGTRDVVVAGARAL